MKPTTATIIDALRSGLATKKELADYHGCELGDLRKPIDNILQRGMITRALRDGQPEYTLTAKGKAWKPGMQGANVRKSVERETQGADSEGGETDVRAVSQDAHIDRIFAAAPELQYLAPEDYAMPEPDAKLLAMANRELIDRLDARDGELLEQAKLVVSLRDAVTNGKALADKLQHLLTSKEHECEALRAQSCNGGCKPDMETVPLADLIRHIALFLDDGQSLTIYGSDTASVQAFGKSFVCTYAEANSVLDASAMLARLEAVA